MRSLPMAATLAGVILVCGCAKKAEQSQRPTTPPPHAAADEGIIFKPGQSLAPEQMADPRYPAIVHVVSRGHVVTVRSGPDGLLYSMKDATGQTVLADATGPELKRQHPELYQAIRHYIAVEADAAPAVQADRPVPDARVGEGR